jgi:hypothetical protein
MKILRISCSDSRAEQISEGIGLPVVDRSRLELLESEINAQWLTLLQINFGAVSQRAAQVQR